MDKSKIFGISCFVLVFIGIGIVVFVKQFVENYDPILDFLPRPDPSSDSSLIWINRKNDMNESPWENQLTNFLREYSESTNSKGSGQNCTYENGRVATEGNHCVVHIDNLVRRFIPSDQDVTRFGYIRGNASPSIALTLRTMEGWVPEPYTVEDLQLAEEMQMPADYRRLIRYLDSLPVSDSTRRQSNLTWISCQGATASDEENIGGRIHFYVPGLETPNFPGFPDYYFPYLKQPGYQIPFLIVQFVNPQVNVLISVECKAWAKNIGPDEHKGFVKVEFDLLID